MRGRLVNRTWEHDPTLPAPPRYRRACAYDAFVPDHLANLSITLDGELAGLISEAEAQISDLNKTSAAALAPLARLLLRTESIASSKVEGLQVDARTLARAEVAHDTGGRVGSEAAEILANVDAMRFAIETVTSDATIEPEHILDIHRVLMARTSLADRAGRFRLTQGWIGGNDYNPCGAAFVPAPEDEIERLVEDLCGFANDDRLPPILQAGIAHAQFETIHPFDDGNGRTGRTLIQVLLRRRGLAPTFVPPISAVLAAEKDRYIRGLTSFREDDDLTDWLEVFALATARSARLARGYLADVQRLVEEWKGRLTSTVKPRADAAAWSIIDILPGYPVITVAVGLAAVEATGRRRSRAAIQVAFDQLVAAGVLLPVSASKRNRAWEAAGLLDLVVDLESGRSIELK